MHRCIGGSSAPRVAPCLGMRGVPADPCHVLPPQCPSTGCLGLARLLVDCESCLAFGGAGPGPPRAPGPFGWCVQNDTCMPIAGEWGSTPEMVGL